MEASPSRTAMLAAASRGALRLREKPPCVLDDPFAHMFLGPSWTEIDELGAALLPLEALREARAGMGVRSRYAEDRLRAGTFSQYVVLGAGLDSFAWRYPELLASVTLFEVDHPASQAWKRQRIAELGLSVSRSQVFVPIDFESESLRQCLDSTEFDWKQRTLFSWLGVVPYLTTGAVETTLKTISYATSGSEVVFSYRTEDALLDEVGRTFTAIMTPLAEAAGEHPQSGWSASMAEKLVGSCGLAVVDHPTREDLIERYFAGRSDGLIPYSIESLIAATVL
jgi:methyltransferase (TIGR00027 family)